MTLPGRYWLLPLLILGMLFPVAVKCQVQVTQGTGIGLTPQEFVETYLVGTGITVSNAKYNGSSEPLNSTNRIPLKSRDQIGSFLNSGGAELELGIVGGVLLSSGFTGKAVTGNNPSDDMWGNSQPAESDPDLVILANNTINDKSVLEFDFVPQTDVVTFRYVFGSIEFDQYCSSINDAFGLFLSGPGISGGLGFVNDAVNIALLPNSTNYVNIFNICAADQGNLGNGIYSWWNDKKDNFSYNRLTHVFSASYTVVCNQTYHMKFAIGDASDGVLDSGVFLEQNSFSSNNVTSTTTFSNPLTGQLLVEGCNNVSLVYSIALAKQTELSIDLVIHPSGTANQADITPNPFPNKAFIPAGQLQSTPILINAILDGITEGTENLVIKGTPPIICGIDNTITNEFSINDYNALTISMPNVTICDGNSYTLAPVIVGGQPILPANTYDFLWSTGATTASIVVSPPPGPNLYSVTVTDACSQTISKEISVDVGTAPGPAGQITGIATICTPLAGVNYSIPIIPGAESYLWTFPAGVTVTSGGNTNAITVAFSTSATSGTISVKGHSTFCGDGAPSILSLTINPSPEPAGPISGLASLCQGPLLHSYSIVPLPNAASYDWAVPPGVIIVSGSGTNTISCLFGPGSLSGNFTVQGYNTQCNYGAPSILAVTVNPLPGNAGSIATTEGSVVCQRQDGVAYSITPVPFASTYNWYYTGTGVTLTNNGAGLLIDFSSTATSGTLTVNGQNSCGGGQMSLPFSITVKPKPTVQFSVCNAIKTTKNGRPIVLRGGNPIGSGGVYSGTGVALVPPDTYVFDPSNNAVAGGTQVTGINHQVMYRYTNSQGCYDDQTIEIAVYASNGGEPCPGPLKDHRDGQVYPSFLSGTGFNARCWMAANLNYGTFTDDQTVQTDNCTYQKYCPGNLDPQCLLSGGYYQWGELMEYQENNGFQDICPAGWHVPGAAEWQVLIDDYQGDGIAGSNLIDPNASPGFHGLLNGILYLNSVWAFDASDNINATMFWTSTTTGGRPIARGLNVITPSVSKYESSGANAFPVRCVRN